MFRSLASSLFTLFVVLVAGFLVLFLISGSDDIRYEQNALEGDQSLGDLIAIAERASKPDTSFDTDMDDKAPMKAEPKPGLKDGGPPVVVWISIPGFRGDYIESSEAEFLEKMTREGAATSDVKPTFPCLTFPSHAALATGAKTGAHGITMDHFRVDGAIVENPGADLLMAEPIWKTATRQGIRTLVHDWPMAQGLAEDEAAISLPSYDPALTDQQRLDAALAAWEADSAGPGADSKLRLVMLRLNDIVNAGKANGPRADEVFEVVNATSTALEGFFGKLEEKWETIAPAGSSLAVMVTTDHGLAELTTQVNLEQLLSEQSFAANLEMVTSGAIAHLFFKDLPENEGQRAIFEENFDSEMKRNIYFRTYKPEDLPEDWNYNIEGRIGDRVLVLKSRYAFTDFKGEEAIFAPAEGDGIFAAWGYPVESSVRMQGQAIIWGLPDSPIRSMGDDIDTTVFHATATKLLGIEKAASATGMPLE